MNIETELQPTTLCRWKLERDNGNFKSLLCKSCNGVTKECNNYELGIRKIIKYGYSDYMK